MYAITGEPQEQKTKKRESSTISFIGTTYLDTLGSKLFFYFYFNQNMESELKKAVALDRGRLWKTFHAMLRI